MKALLLAPDLFALMATGTGSVDVTMELASIDFGLDVMNAWARARTGASRWAWPCGSRSRPWPRSDAREGCGAAALMATR